MRLLSWPPALACKTQAREIQKLNYRQYDNPELERLAGEIRTCAAALKE